MPTARPCRNWWQCFLEWWRRQFSPPSPPAPVTRALTATVRGTSDATSTITVAARTRPLAAHVTGSSDATASVTAAPATPPANVITFGGEPVTFDSEVVTYAGT